MSIEVTNTSAWNRFTANVVDGANWCGRQVQWLAGTIKDGVKAIYEFIAPYFQSAFAFMGQKFQALKELMVQNKEITMIVGGCAVLAIAIGAIFYWAPSKQTA